MNNKQTNDNKMIDEKKGSLSELSTSIKAAVEVTASNMSEKAKEISATTVEKLDNYTKQQMENQEKKKANKVEDSIAEGNTAGFCSNCGSKLTSQEKFCKNCGKQVGDNEIMPPIPQTEKPKSNSQSIKKCPSCGAPILSFTAVCPDCGHEFNDQFVDETFQAFVDKLDECDKKIANKTASKKIVKKALWIFLNMCTLCFPILISRVIPNAEMLFYTNKKPTLTAEEQEKLIFIENFTFPNERESLLEALVFIKSKIIYLGKEQQNFKTIFWARIWKEKAEEIFKKIELLKIDDNIAKNTLIDVENEYAAILKKSKGKAIFSFIIIVAIVALIVGRSIAMDIEEANYIPYDENFTWPSNELTATVPALQGSHGKLVSSDEEKIDIRIYDFTESDYKDYIESCKDKGFTIDQENNETLLDFTAHNEEGYKLELDYTDYSKNPYLEIVITAPMQMEEIVWPSSGMFKNLPIPNSTYGKISSESSTFFVAYVGKTTHEEYSTYVDECIKNGFTEDYTKNENYFRGSNKNGEEITVSYEGYNIMYVKMTDYD